ncbi:hypothetical protein NPIL_75511 [Nephila pilipes]|uniref:Uncharacterized protein n=1 Tax=Nephila pilipes TaxID=299642 RepID=A0A8X6PX65_NEPPI|nr:hypothetical protein NPIL_75511 [Nephila pilipes]
MLNGRCVICFNVRNNRKRDFALCGRTSSLAKFVPRVPLATLHNVAAGAPVFEHGTCGLSIYLDEQCSQGRNFMVMNEDTLRQRSLFFASNLVFLMKEMRKKNTLRNEKMQLGVQ